MIRTEIVPRFDRAYNLDRYDLCIFRYQWEMDEDNPHSYPKNRKCWQLVFVGDNDLPEWIEFEELGTTPEPTLAISGAIIHASSTMKAPIFDLNQWFVDWVEDYLKPVFEKANESAGVGAG